MTVMVEKASKVTIGDIGHPNSDLHGLPIEVLDGLGDHVGDLDMAAQAAAEVYNNWSDDTWRNAFIMALQEHIDNQVAHYRPLIQGMVNRAHSNVGKSMRRAIVKQYIKDTLMDTVSKAEETIRVDDYYRRGEKVHGYTYRRSGKGPLGTGRRTGGPGGLAPRQAVPGYGGYGAEAPEGQELTPWGMYEDADPEEQRRAARTMAATLANAYRDKADGEDAKAQHAEFTVVKPNGEVHTYISTNGQVPKGIDRRDRIVRMRGLGIENPVTIGGDTFNLAQMVGASAAKAGSAGAVAQGVHDQLKFSEEAQPWGDRLTGAMEILHHATGGRYAPAHIQAAIATGKYVGKHGPEVTRVLGPHMRRMTYKYGGTTADSTQWIDTARNTRTKDSQGNPESLRAVERKLTLALARKPTNDMDGLDAIPSEQQTYLMLKTGSTPPSHGFIIDKTGVVRQQAVGDKDDHYVPFNLRDLHHLNEGSYVRSRAFGGPTTEDFALAAKTGARSFETISRHGIYRVEFYPRLNKKSTKAHAWTRDTLGDAKITMVNRYGRLLDAIKNGNVQDPDFPDDENKKLKLDGHGYAVALQAMKKQYPYFIKDVEYHPAEGDRSRKLPAIKELEGSRSREKDDVGYVRPFYLKPSDAKAGYWDPKLRPSGAEPSGYDEIAGYRLGKANVLQKARELAQAQEEAKRKADQERGSGKPTPLSTGGAAPGSVPRHAAEAAAAAGTDIGEAQSEVLARLARNRGAIKDQRESDAYIGYVRAVLNNAALGEGTPHELEEVRRELNWHDSPDPARYKRYMNQIHRIRWNVNGHREAIDDWIRDLTPIDKAHETGLEKAYAQRPKLLSAGEKTEEQEKAEVGQVPEADAPLRMEMEEPEHQAYQRLQRYRQLLPDRQKKRQDLNDPTWNYPNNPANRAVMEEFDGPSDDPDLPPNMPDDQKPTKYHDWTTPKHKHGGISLEQDHENRLHAAELQANVPKGQYQWPKKHPEYPKGSPGAGEWHEPPEDYDPEPTETPAGRHAMAASEATRSGGSRSAERLGESADETRANEINYLIENGQALEDRDLEDMARLKADGWYFPEGRKPPF